MFAAAEERLRRHPPFIYNCSPVYYTWNPGGFQLLFFYHNVKNYLIGDVHSVPAKDAHFLVSVFNALFDNALAVDKFLAGQRHLKS